MEDEHPTSDGERPEFTIKTWRYLRVGMIALVIALSAAVVYEVIRRGDGCWQTSISAYYYTHAQAIFVGSLIAIGVCLICLRGSTEPEDILLNLAGMLAPIVAIVPTPHAGKCTSLEGTPADPTLNIENNITALLVVGPAAFILLAVLAAIDRRRKDAPVSRPARSALIGYGAALLLCLVIAWRFLGHRPWFVEHGHDGAAYTMFGLIILVAVLNAFSFMHKQGDPNAANRYLLLAIVMPLTVLGLWLFAGKYNVLLAEAAAILLFAIFWGIQTEELWDEGLRPSGSTG